MKKNPCFVLLLALCFIASCKKEDQTGQVMFWSNANVGVITVNTNNQSQQVADYYCCSAPTCGASGCATFSFVPGNYSYSASSSAGTWSGNYTIASGGCQLVELTGSGGGGNTGTLMFWEYEQGNVATVNVDGYTGSITSYYPNNSTSNAPACSSAGCYSVNLPYGSYYYSASDGVHSWSGAANVTGSCNTFLLYW